MTHQKISLNDRFDLEKSPVLLNGTQALVRLMMMQKRRMGRQGSILHSDNRIENLTWMTKKAGTIDRSRSTTTMDRRCTW